MREKAEDLSGRVGKVKAGYTFFWSKLSKSHRERQISYDITYMWDLKKGYKWTYLQNRNRVTDVENKLIVTKGEGGG